MKPLLKRHRTLLVGVVLAGLLGCNGGGWSSGDRVLVAKCLYDTGVSAPQRYDVVVFKYPQRPVEDHTPKNYIKRLIGLPGEIIAMFFGQLYRWAPEPGELPPFHEDDKDVEPGRLWHVGNTHPNDDRARRLFEQGKFEILRKPPEVMLALRRIVFDNDYQPRDLLEMGVKRWDASRAPGWKDETDNRFLAKADAQNVAWLRYQHLVVPRSAEQPAAGGRAVKPQLITDQLGYNSFQTAGGFDSSPSHNWVGDLMLECNVEVVGGAGELALELSKGRDRFQARWNLADGTCTLVRLPDGGNKEEVLDSKPSKLKGPGSYLVRFANFDSRLTVWVDRELPFDEGHAYPPPEAPTKGSAATADELKARRGPTKNDLEPAGVGVKGGEVRLSHLRLWRDTYYTTHGQSADYQHGHGGGEEPMASPEAWSDPAKWAPLRNQDFRTWYVQPGHYLCLGDNSTASSDGREWGLVPERLMLGRALVVYYPFNRAGPIR